MKKTGFTLSELMIALTVLGLLCAALLPTIMKTMPNQNKIMMKRAYYTTSNIVSDMINNPNLYPMIDSDGNETVGFDNTDPVTYGGKTYGGTTPTNDGHGAFAKFIDLFSAHLNTDGEIDDECPSESYDPENPPISPGGSSGWEYCRSFTTPDGIAWDLRTTHKVETFSTTTVITVDVNGANKPNCMQGDSDADTKCKDRTKNFDRFSMIIKDDGTIEIPENQTWVREALQVSSSLTD